MNFLSDQSSSVAERELEKKRVSVPEVYRSIAVLKNGTFWQKLFAFAGPGFLVSVGYMDPGNWATDLAGGAQFGYRLLFIILLSNFMAILLQYLCIKLGIVTGRDLAQACRDHYSPAVAFSLWIICEIAIIACDLAEVVGSAIALQLLFGLPLVWGCLFTGLDVLVILFLQKKGFRSLEAIVVSMVGLIALCFVCELCFAHPGWGGVLRGFIPSSAIFTDRNMLFVAIGIIGATVMPHNLYLHSAIVQTRRFEKTAAGKREAIRFASIDSAGALMFALLVNAAILILAAAVFHWSGHQNVAEIQDAYRLLTPLMGMGMASGIFALALLASGQNSTLTGTLAGQIVMEGFMHLRVAPWLRRLITRSLAVFPAVLIIGLYGENKTNDLLIWSQVVLSLQLPFAIVPLVLFTNDRKKMGEFKNNWWIQALAITISAIIIILNFKLIWDQIFAS